MPITAVALRYQVDPPASWAKFGYRRWSMWPCLSSSDSSGNSSISTMTIGPLRLLCAVPGSAAARAGVDRSSSEAGDSSRNTSTNTTGERHRQQHDVARVGLAEQQEVGAAAEHVQQRLRDHEPGQGEQVQERQQLVAGGRPQALPGGGRRWGQVFHTAGNTTRLPAARPWPPPGGCLPGRNGSATCARSSRCCRRRPATTTGWWSGSTSATTTPATTAAPGPTPAGSGYRP